MPLRPLPPGQQLPQVPGDSTQNRANDILHNRIKALEDRTRESSAVPGRWLNRQTFTASGIYVPTPGTNRALVRMCGGGGGAGGASTAGGAGSSGGGGSATGLEFVLSGSSVAAGTVAIGSAGTGGTSGGAGGAGGDTVLTIGSTTYTSKGGAGGGGGTQAGAVGSAFGGGTQAGSTAVGVQFGSRGQAGLVLDNGVGGIPVSAGGGPCGPLGAGGTPMLFSNSTPSAPGGYGGGGGGVFTTGGTSVAGGPGAPGVVVIDEYS